MSGFYLDCKRNQNNMSYWFPKIQGKGLNIPDTIIIPLSEGEFNWIIGDDYKKEDVEEFSKSLQSRIANTGFDTGREFFIKTGNFSNKFVFRFPHLKDINKIGEQFLNVMYGGLCVGCLPSPEVVIREFVHTSYTRKSIYDGMKLNSEFRCFYNFSNKKLLDIFNYWDTETMLNNLYSEEDRSAFQEECKNIETDFIQLKPELQKYIGSKFENVELSGIWSADFMWDGEKFWLIDMALGKDSYYFERIKES